MSNTNIGESFVPVHPLASETEGEEGQGPKGRVPRDVCPGNNQVRDAPSEQPGITSLGCPREGVNRGTRTGLPPLLFSSSVSQDIALMLQGNPPTFEPSAGELLADEPGQTTLLFGLENDALMPMEKGFSPEGLQPENGGETLDMVSRGCPRASN